MKSWKATYYYVLVALALLLATSVSAQTLKRLTTDGQVSKRGLTISGDGTTVAWFENIGNQHLLKVAPANGSEAPRTVLASINGYVDSVYVGVAGLHGPKWPSGIYVIECRIDAVRLSHDGKKALVLLEENPDNSWYKAFGVVNTDTGAIETIAPAVPAGMGANTDFDGQLRKLGLQTLNSFEISADGSTIFYTVTVKSDFDGINHEQSVEDGSAVIALNISSRTATRLAGYTAYSGGAISYPDSGPAHVNAPVMVGWDYLAFAGNENKARGGWYGTADLTTVYAVPIVGGAMTALGAFGGYPLAGAWPYAYARKDASTGRFMPVVPGYQPIEIPIGSSALDPFWDGNPGVLDLKLHPMVPQFSESLGLYRSGGRETLLNSTDPALPAGLSFGILSESTDETSRLASDNGLHLLFPMLSMNENKEDLFVLLRSSGTPTPSVTPGTGPTATPTAVAPTATPTAMPAEAVCRLSVSRDCRGSTRAGTKCVFTVKAYHAQGKKPYAKSDYEIQSKQTGQNYRRANKGRLSAKGLGSLTISARKTALYRGWVKVAECYTNELRVSVQRRR